LSPQCKHSHTEYCGRTLFLIIPFVNTDMQAHIWPVVCLFVFVFIIIIIIIIIITECHKQHLVQGLQGCTHGDTQRSHWNERLNSSLLSRRRKIASDSDDWTVSGRLFQARAADTLNARSPMVACLVRWMVRCELFLLCFKFNCYQLVCVSIAQRQWSRDWVERLSFDVLFRVRSPYSLLCMHDTASQPTSGVCRAYVYRN